MDCFVEAGVRYCLPVLIGVASVRAGTTSLAQYLNAHPLLSFGTTKEHWFFRFQPVASGPEADTPIAQLASGDWIPVNLTYDTGTPDTRWIRQIGQGDWKSYARQFPVDGLAFDFDPVYLAHAMFSRASLAAMRAIVPRAKLLAVFRDPSRQACSRRGSVECAAALAARDWSSSACSPSARDNFHNYCYVDHVVEWRAASYEALLVKSEDLDRDARSVVDAIIAFAGLPPYDFPDDVLRQRHNTHPRDASVVELECARVHRAPNSYLGDCNRRLAAIEHDERWLWWPSAPARVDDESPTNNDVQQEL